MSTKTPTSQRAAKNFVYGKTITGGQRCTSIQEVFCDESVYEAFVAAAIEETKGIRIGDGSSQEMADADKTPGLYSLPPLVSEEQQARVLGLISQSVSEGANIRHQVPVPDALAAEGCYVPFTLIENVGTGQHLLHHRSLRPCRHPHQSQEHPGSHHRHQPEDRHRRLH